MNQLFYHHQMALIEADRAKRGGESGEAHSDRSRHYARRIDAYRAERGLTAYFADPAAAPER